MSRFYLLFSAAGLFAVALSYGIAPAAVVRRSTSPTVETDVGKAASFAIRQLHSVSTTESSSG